MEIIEIFQVLGIEATKDERAIKNAYREKLSVTNPEDNPEGFKRLRAAYEEACVYAKQAEEEGVPEADETPSGLWVQKAEALYKNILDRQNVEKWEALFEEDVFLSLEEEENCRFKLLRFMMDNWRFPTAIWKVFDKKMNLKADSQKLRETFPADFLNYVFARLERGEDVEYEQFEGEPEAEYDLFLQYYDRCWNALQEKEYAQAEEFIRNADDLMIFHPVMEVCRAHLYVAQERVDDAIEILVNLRKRYPTDAMICYNAAEIMWSHDRKEEAAIVYTELKAVVENHYMANMRLTEWNYENGRYEEAKKCAEKVLSHGADDDFMELLAKVNFEMEKGFEESFRANQDVHSALELGWCYLQDGKTAKGIHLIEGLNPEAIPEDRISEYRGLLTKLYIEETDYEKAMKMASQWEIALKKRLSSDESEEEKEKDRDRIKQFHLISMQCYRNFGDMSSTRTPEECRKDYEKAIAEIDGQLNGSGQDIGLLLEKAQIYMEMEEYEKSLETTRILIEEYQIYAAYATELEVYRRQWDAGGVVQSARYCINYFPNYIKAYEYSAKVYLDLKREDDLKTILEEAKNNNIESCYLEAYRYKLDHEIPDTDVLEKKLDEFRKKYNERVEWGNMKFYEEGLPILTEYLYWYPSTYMLVERGLFHRYARRYEESKADFEKALAENPFHPYALNGLAFVYKYLGDYEQALVCFKRAYRHRDPEMSNVIFADMSRVYSLMGLYEEALDSYKKFTDGAYKGTYHMTGLAECMARCGDVTGAAKILRQEYKDEPCRYFRESMDYYLEAGIERYANQTFGKWQAYLNNPDNKEKVTSREWADYYMDMAWYDLIFAEGEKAVEYYKTGIRYFEESKPSSAEYKGKYADMVFVCILCGEEAIGKKYAQSLITYVQSVERGSQNYFVDVKQNVRQKFFGRYYEADWDAEEMKALLKQGDAGEICHWCTKCCCSEMEAAWIVYLIRIGNIEDAKERLLRNLERQPMDDYMRAILNILGRKIGISQKQEYELKNAKLFEKDRNKADDSEALANRAEANEIRKREAKAPNAAKTEADTGRAEVHVYEKKGILGKLKGFFGKK